LCITWQPSQAATPPAWNVPVSALVALLNGPLACQRLVLSVIAGQHLLAGVLCIRVPEGERDGAGHRPLQHCIHFDDSRDF
jgi:hypothetical protein